MKKYPIRYLIILLLSFFILYGCKTQPINQKRNKQREGLWIEEYAIDSAAYKSVGKYQNGDPIKKWRYYLNSKIIKKEKYKQNLCYTTFYHQNGKIESKGNSRLESSGTNVHWFYFGDWKFFDEKGKIIKIRKYENGELISEINLK